MSLCRVDAALQWNTIQSLNISLQRIFDVMEIFNTFEWKNHKDILIIWPHFSKEHACVDKKT